MNKNFFQDVVPPERRSIRNIPIERIRRKKNMPLSEEPAFRTGNLQENGLEPTEEYANQAPPKEKRRFLSGKVFIILAIILIMGFVFGMMTAFTSASIDITPKKELVSFNVALEAASNPLPGSGNLRFEVVQIKREDTVEVNANGEEMAEKKASGTVIIYNNFSEETQRLITRTRFETPEGLIFRINESITVPGKTIAGPGQVEATVYADEPGEKHNIGKTDFTIPGFKSDPLRYKGFYAKSEAPMTGGFVGKVKKVNEADKKSALKALEDSIKAELEKEIGAKVPDGFVSLKGSTIYSFKDLGQAESSGSKALLKLEGTAATVVFDKRELASSIASQFLKDWAGLSVEIRSFEDMTVSFDSPPNVSGSTAPEIIPLKLGGSATIFAAVNGIEVAEQLKGLPKSSLNNVMAKFPGVSSAKATIRPLWKSSFPANTAKIHINIE